VGNFDVNVEGQTTLDTWTDLVRFLESGVAGSNLNGQVNTCKEATWAALRQEINQPSTPSDSDGYHICPPTERDR